MEETKVNILIVDDQPVGVIALEAVLSCPEYNLVTAGSGHEALRRVLDDDFALILMDVGMPGMDGFETAAMIKTHARSKDIPIIFITGLSDDERYVRRAYESGAVDYLFKPFDAEILTSKVSVFIELYKKNLMIKKQAELLRQSEISKLEMENLERYRLLADAIPHMVWEAEQDGVLTYFNKAWCDYTGLTLEQSTGGDWRSMIHEEDLKGFLEALKSASETNKSFEIECRIRRGSDPMDRWHLILMVPEKNPAGQVDAWLGTATDIHDRKQIENELRRASDAAQEAIQVKSNFLATMSHEIRTPMNSINGMTNLLLDTPMTPEQRDFTETIRHSCATLLTLINNILDFSKIESGKIEFESVDFHLGRLIQDCEKTFQNMVQQKGIQLFSEIQLGVPLELRGDSARVQQVLMNLINNAIKFTKNGSVSIRVQTDGEGPDGKMRLKFEIEDTGIGIPEGAVSRMFQRFSQADSSTTRKFGGTGLGLSICKHLVELMGGKIGLSSEVGKGSTFWFALEFEKSHEVLTKVETQLNDQPRKLKTGRILLAEDNISNQKVVLRLLEKLGYRADAVANGREAIDALHEIRYDLVLMDWQMPEMDGREATRSIRDSATLGCREIPIIAMTANAMGGDREKCLEAGMNDYLAKPIEFKLLEITLDKWIPHAQSENRKPA